MTRNADEMTLEAALERLEEIARELEGGDLELAASLALYEEAVGLIRRAEGVLGDAEARVQRLRVDGQEVRVEPMGEEP